MKKKYKTFHLPPYNFTKGSRVYIDFKEAKAPFEIDSSSISGYATFDLNQKVNGIYVEVDQEIIRGLSDLIKNKKLFEAVKTILHEATHYTVFVFEGAGVKLNDSNAEPLAYSIEHVFQKVSEGISKFKIDDKNMGLPASGNKG